jgi:transmembrane sensor
MENEHDHIEMNSLFVRYLSGEASEADKSTLKGWLSKNPSNRKLFEEFRRLWTGVDMLRAHQEIDLEQEWQLLTAELKTNQIVHPPAGRSKTLISQFMRVAAILIVGLFCTGLVYWYFASPSTKTIQTAGNILQLTLPDGSILSLNRYSELSYPTKFKGNERRVQLKGEAFFEVSPDKKHPFVITCSGTEIRVLGTSFNVSAYEGSQKVEVIVRTGKVSLAAIHDSSSSVSLLPGEKGIYSLVEKSVKREPNKNTNFLSWKTKKFSYEDSPLLTILTDLNKAYGLKLVLKTPATGSCPVTVTFDNLSLDAVLEILKNTLDLKVEIRKDTIEISGKGC